MSENTNIPIEGEDNSTIAQMRQQIRALSQENKAKDAELGTIRSQLEASSARIAEFEPLSASFEQLRAEHEAKLSELSGLSSVQAEKERYSATLEKIFGEELARVPSERQEALLKLAGEGAWDVRLVNLREALSLLPVGREPLRIGSSTQAGTPGVGTGSATMFDPKNPPSWSQALKR